ncbi:MAG TPA: DsbA family protein [Chloroflexota bacterium]|nr:DsbA family protein [Chloroflexota bacterium]
MTTNQPTERVEFFFDPLCPWAWLTSLWIREVQKHHPLHVEWKFFSLAGINDRADEWHGPLRIAALARREGGNDAAGRAYLALGRLFHERSDSFDQIGELAELAAPYLEDVGLPGDLSSRALQDESTLEDVLADHRPAVEKLGAFGVPWIVVEGDERGFFGPVVGEDLRGQEAVDLWHHFRWMANRPYLYELKRGGRKRLQDLSGLSLRFGEPVSAAR